MDLQNLEQVMWSCWSCVYRNQKPSSYLGVVSFPQVVRQVMLDLSDELLGVVRVETEHLAEAFEADVLQVTVSQGLHTGVGFNHFLLGQAVRANQVAPAWKEDVQLGL